MLATNIRKIREQRGFTRKHIAYKARVKLRTYVSYETGERTPPLPVAERLAYALGCTIDELMRDSSTAAVPTHSTSIA